jgi:hypothetical protein
MPLPREPFKVFISHATIEDGALVNWMANALDRLHIRAFVYERYPMGGRNRFEVIKNMIGLCPYFLVLLTRDGITSQWVNQEIGYAVGVGKTPIPIVEVDSTTGRRIESKGFIELHDPIDYYRNNEGGLMASVIYTFYGWLLSEGKWTNSIFLSCRCGYNFEGDLRFDESWEKWQEDPQRKPLCIEYLCDRCQRTVTISFPDCHLLPQEVYKP